MNISRALRVISFSNLVKKPSSVKERKLIPQWSIAGRLANSKNEMSEREREKARQTKFENYIFFLKDKHCSIPIKWIFFNITKMILMVIVSACFKRFLAVFGIFIIRITIYWMPFHSFSSHFSISIIFFYDFGNAENMKVFFFFSLSVYFDACWMLTSLRMCLFENTIFNFLCYIRRMGDLAESNSVLNHCSPLAHTIKQCFIRFVWLDSKTVLISAYRLNFVFRFFLH